MGVVYEDLKKMKKSELLKIYVENPWSVDKRTTKADIIAFILRPE